MERVLENIYDVYMTYCTMYKDIFLEKRVRLRVKFLCYKFMISILKKRIIVRERRLSFYHLKHVKKKAANEAVAGALQ